MSAVKLVSAGENKGRMRRTSACEKAGFDVEKQDVAFSKSIVEIKSRKRKSEFLLVASLSTEKESVDDFHAILKAKAEKENPDSCQVFITWHSFNQPGSSHA